MTGLDNGGRDGQNSTRENADKAANEDIYSNETGRSRFVESKCIQGWIQHSLLEGGC